MPTDGLLRQLYVDCEREANAVNSRRSQQQLTKRARLPALRCIARGNVMQLITQCIAGLSTPLRFQSVAEAELYGKARVIDGRRNRLAQDIAAELRRIDYNPGAVKTGGE